MTLPTCNIADGPDDLDDLEYLMAEESGYSVSDETLDEYEKLLKQEAAFTSFHAFIEYTMPKYKFNWHHDAMIERLDKLVHQKNQRIIIEMPPRHGKSELVSRRFPAYFLGRHPDKEVIACSYSAALATTFNRDVQRILESEEYHEVFPDTLIPNTVFSREHPDNAKYKKTTSLFEIIGHSGQLLSAGVGGSITGQGADLLVIDDPFKNEEEAMSEVIREGVFGWYNSTAYTRLEGGANVVICMTRWHLQDLCGKLISEMEFGGETWEVISFPAIATAKRCEIDPRKKGEPLWPGKYDIERLETIKRQVGARVWSALYQQSPIIEGGNIVKADDFQYYNILPFDLTRWREAYLVTSWDLSFKETGKSYVVGVVLAKHGPNYYLVDIYRKKASFSESRNAILRFAEKYVQCRTILIEDKANGPAIISELKKKIPFIIPVTPTSSKDERLHAIAPIIEAGNFLLPANHPMTKPIVDEMTSFPNAENDDITDAISQGLTHYMEMRGLRHLKATSKW